MTESVAIVGGGIQGTLCALACAARGMHVVLFERRPELWLGASRNNEGKIHLGFTYALDATGKTQETMARQGSQFHRMLSQLVPDLPADLYLAREVVYARHRHSRLSQSGTEQHFAATAARLGRAGCHAEVTALDPAQLKRYFSDEITDACIVPEATVSPARLRDAVVSRVLANQSIEVVADTTISRVAAGTRPTVFGGGNQPLGSFDHVLNCAWDGLPELDRASGHGTDIYCVRAKAGFVTTGVNHGCPLPVTISFGPFGDLVPMGADRFYVSWYPSCLMGITTDLAQGPEWFDACRRDFDFAAAYEGSRQAFERLCPGLSLASGYGEVLAGPILAAGKTDIYDPGSQLHERTAIGITVAGNFVSVNPGKLATAPYWADEAARVIAA